MNLEEKREYAKSELGITQAFNMKEETLDKKIAEAEKPKPIQIGANGKAILDFFQIPEEMVHKIVDANGWDKIEYIKHKKAFKCFVDGEPVGFLDIHKINELNQQFGD